MLSIEHLNFSFGKHNVINELSVGIKNGAITTLMGGNGCGKTTLLNLLTKNLKPFSGVIQMEGRDLSEITLREFARMAAIVHQKNIAPDDLTVAELVSYGRIPYSSIFRPNMNEENRNQIERALILTNLTELRERRLGTLSGGQRQRAFIAAALAQNTRLLYLDEPTTFLDVRYQVEILKLIKSLNKEQGITIVMVLHDINQALAYSDYIIGLRAGRVVVQGEPEKVINSESIKTIYGIELPVYKTDGCLCVLAV